MLRMGTPKQKNKNQSSETAKDLTNEYKLSNEEQNNNMGHANRNNNLDNNLDMSNNIQILAI